VISWAMGDPMVDKNRIGIRGPSYSGGHVFYVAAHDPRVKAAVSRAGAFDSRWPRWATTECVSRRMRRVRNGHVARPILHRERSSSAVSSAHRFAKS
jgi:cephalosporin-C deacetylase-like acetyl esterase